MDVKLDEARIGESPMATIVGIAGSLRSGSFNAALLRTGPEGCTVDIASIRRTPIYDGDIVIPKNIHEKFVRA